ncbi:MAG: hypothetical protein NT085_03370 [candidate division SR1 bacterium]|nr:hypothetical protein [candidate division SR1 bacterium]
MKKIIAVIVMIIVVFIAMIQTVSNNYSVVILNGSRDTMSVISWGIHAGDTICLEKLSYDNNEGKWLYSPSTKVPVMYISEPVMVLEEDSQNSCGMYLSVFSQEEWAEYNLKREHRMFSPNGKREIAKAIIIEKKWFWSD